ncbi:hypothetical protein NLJ89_g4503 [Agrocybe chaxingu]|uniref:Uncharacterized protein n=1 Tax=Agrocybe chaxingu TaxID=84603 RepID=A0A9W8MUI0_9AGAR|nr:hypothetical protein NLJ89_g4503 [Agrocybe chaxingu]
MWATSGVFAKSGNSAASMLSFIQKTPNLLGDSALCRTLSFASKKNQAERLPEAQLTKFAFVKEEFTQVFRKVARPGSKADTMTPISETAELSSVLYIDEYFGSKDRRDPTVDSGIGNKREQAVRVTRERWIAGQRRKINVNKGQHITSPWYTANTQLEHLHARYTGTGHADLSKYEWLTHQHRDTLSSIVGHPTLASYLAIADGEAIGRIKFEMTERMLQPCGPPPKKDDD